MKKWQLLSPRSNEEILQILLKNRGLTQHDEIEQYLHPKLEMLTYESVGLDTTKMDVAVSRLKKARDTHESVVVYTDYDVDGVSGGAIIWEILHSFGLNVAPYIPHRVEEGYGLSKKGIDAIVEKYSVSLLVTVDHGIVAAEKIAYAKSLGIETIILDHHVLPDTLPEAVAIVHTTKLCAGGIAWFFANYLKAIFTGHDPMIIEKSNIELAALATIADLIPLTGPNRVIVSQGLKALNKTKRIGLVALIKESGLTMGDLDVYDVSHILAPRINAMGRLTHALDALRLLCTKDEERAKQLATELTATNKERQVLTMDATTHALDIVKNYNQTDRLIFVSHGSYNQGVIGLIAGRLVQTYHLPAIVLSEGTEYSKASARSISGFNIVETIRKTADILVDVGGHPMAAGFTVETKHIPELRKRLLELAQLSITDEMLVRTIKIDTTLDVNEITKGLYDTIKRLSPFGVGNSQPVFATMGIPLVKIQTVGREDKHVKMFFKVANGTIEAIGFGLGELYKDFRHDDLVDIVYTIDLDIWNNRERLQLKLIDVKMSQIGKGIDGADTPEPRKDL